jgi:hypothetical protein
MITACSFRTALTPESECQFPFDMAKLASRSPL